MKKFLNCCLLLLLLIVFTSSNVNAEEVSLKSLPKEFTSDDIKYSIDSFEIRVYDASTDAEGNSKYITDKKVLYTIPITGDDLTINPTTTKSKLYEVPATFVKLNLNVDNNKVLQLVKEKISNTTSDASYMFEVVVNYKINTVPEEYKYRAYFNLLDFMISIVGKENENKNAFQNIELNTKTTQIINIGSIVRKDGNEQINYGDSINSEGETVSSSSGAMLDYAILSKTEDFISSENDSTNSYIFMLHDINDIDKVISDNQKSFEQTKDEYNADINSKNNSQQVKVDDTGISIPTIVYALGVFVIIFGVAIIVKTVYFRKRNS